MVNKKLFIFIFIFLAMFSVSFSYAAKIDLEFARKGDNFRILVTNYENHGYSFFENNELGTVLIDIIGQEHIGGEMRYPFNEGLLYEAIVAKHPAIKSVTRVSLKLRSSLLESVRIQGNAIEVILSKTEEITSGTKVIESPVSAHIKPSSSIDEAYKIGAGDTVDIDVYGNAELTLSKKVPPDGIIPYPYIGDINVIGMTVYELRNSIQKRLEDGFIVDPIVTVSVSDYKSQWAYVTGNVTKPGMVYLKGPTKLIELLSEVGGTEWHLLFLTKGNSNKKIEIRKADLYKKGSQESNIIIEHGDKVEIPKNFYYVSGEVNHPGSFDYTDNITLYKAITEAGGISGWGDRKKVELLRAGNKSGKKQVFNLNKIENGKMKDIVLKPEDHIIVQRKSLF